MGQFATAIPEKIFFKIGEVCDLVGVQAHVLRYWETEFPMLSPQKNRSGQRSYRRRDVEIALRVKELLYEDLYTIAGAKKKLQIEMRETSRLKIVHSEQTQQAKESFIREVKATEPQLSPIEESVGDDINDGIKPVETQTVEDFGEIDEYEMSAPGEMMTEDRREALTNLASQLLELREMLKTKKFDEPKPHGRNY